MPGSAKQPAREEGMPKLTEEQQAEIDYFTIHKAEILNIAQDLEDYRHIMVNIPGINTHDLQRMDLWILRLRDVIKP
jgi:flavorubredoxin